MTFKWSTCAPSMADSVRNNPLLNMHWQQHHCQLFSPPSSATPSSSSRSSTGGPTSAASAMASSRQLWHCFVGSGFLQQPWLPLGFWRRLADSPPHCCCSLCSVESGPSPAPPPFPPAAVPVPCLPYCLSNPCQLHQQQFLFTPPLLGQLFQSQRSEQQQHQQADNNNNNSTFLLNDFTEFADQCGQKNGPTASPRATIHQQTSEGGVGEGSETEEGGEQAQTSGAGSADRRGAGEREEHQEGGCSVRREEEKEEEGTGREESAEKLLLHALSPTPLAAADQQQRHICPLLIHHQQHQQPFLPVSSSQMALVSESFGKMPELERQEEMVDQHMASSSPDSGGEDENVYPPQLDAEETLGQRPLVALPKRLLEMAMSALTTARSKPRPGDDGVPSPCRPRPPPSLSSSHCFSSRCSSTDGTSNNATTAFTNSSSLDGADRQKCHNGRKGSKGIATENGWRRTEQSGIRRGEPLRKRRRGGAARIGPRRKRRGQRHTVRKSADRPHTEALTPPPPIKRGAALVRVPNQKRQTTLLEGNGSPLTTHRKRRQPSTQLHKSGTATAAVSPPLPPRLVSNWRPVGRGCVRRPFPGARDASLCYAAIRHRSVPGVTIRVGDCVQINSADSEDDDLFVGRVVAIHYQPEGPSLQLTLLWFYTLRQLPSAPPLTELDPRELFASKHLDSVNVDSVDAVIHVLTFAEYCRYRAELAMSRVPIGQTIPNGPSQFRPCPRTVANYSRRSFLPLATTSSDAVFFCRGVFSLTKKRIISFGSVKPIKSLRALRPKFTKSSAE